MFKEQKGVTLIALVITIIVLLILAGVSIAMLTGENGILTQANNAKVTNLRATADESVRLAVQAMNLELQTQKVDNSSYSSVGSSTALKALTDDLKPAEDWELPTAIAETTTVKYKNDDFTKANNGKSRVYTITVSGTGITYTVADEK